MQTSDLTLLISGHIIRPQSADMRPFWAGFIELQKKLPIDKTVSKIAVHSWNPELASLAQLVYEPNVQRHDRQDLFYPEFMMMIDPPDLFEKNLNRLKSTWKNVSIQSVLGNARSRARSVALLDELSSPRGQVLITRWDLGQTGSRQVNQLIFDTSLPENYLYLSYFSEIDEGYADMWLIASWNDARLFSCFDQFVSESLEGRNDYLSLFTGGNWPRARAKTRHELFWNHQVLKRVKNLNFKLCSLAQKNVIGRFSLHFFLIHRIIKMMQSFTLYTNLTAENSFLPPHKYQIPRFPNYQALNIHALLKYFILSKGLRDRVRFLNQNDFDLTATSGQLINPESIILIVHEADNVAIKSILNDSPLPLSAVYWNDSGNVRRYIPSGNGIFNAKILQKKTTSSRDFLACAINAELLRKSGSSTILIMPNVQKYLNCTDWYYLNALAKYIKWSQKSYIGLKPGIEGQPNPEFPDLNSVKGKGVFSLNIAAGTLQGLQKYVEIADADLTDVSVRADKMLLEFTVVNKGDGLFQ